MNIKDIKDIEGATFDEIANEFQDVITRVRIGSKDKIRPMVILATADGAAAFIATGSELHAIAISLTVIGKASINVLKTKYVTALFDIAGGIAEDLGMPSKDAVSKETTDELIKFVDDLVEGLSK